MDTGAIDIFATKGVEYLIVIGYLVLLVVFWQLFRRPRTAGDSATADRGVPMPDLPFALHEDLAYHQGHSWVRVPEQGDVVRVGLDDFAQRLLGTPQAIRLPAAGSRLTQGAPAWDVVVHGTRIGMVSPVDGEVVAVNPAVASAPQLVSTEPYEGGWLLDVRLPASRVALKSLLRGRVARAWLRETWDRFRALQTPELGVLMADGGMPVHGLARAAEPDRWAEVARAFLLSEPPAAD